MFGNQLYQSNCVLVVCCEPERHKREEHIRDNHEEERWGKECGVKLDQKMDKKYEQKIVSNDTYHPKCISDRGTCAIP